MAKKKKKDLDISYEDARGLQNMGFDDEKWESLSDDDRAKILKKLRTMREMGYGPDDKIQKKRSK